MNAKKERGIFGLNESIVPLFEKVEVGYLSNLNNDDNYNDKDNNNNNNHDYDDNQVEVSTIVILMD